MREVIARLRPALRRMTGDYQAADAIAYEAGFRLLNQIRNKGEDLRTPMAWAATVARRLALDYLRRAPVRREQPVDVLPEGSGYPGMSDSPDTSNPGARMEYDEMLQSVRKAIGDEQDARIWELRKIWKLSGAEVAVAIGVSEATVSRALSRAAAKAPTAEGLPRPRSGI
ncbi:RNA polymerase sigma factor [Kitasatospora sp. NBC_00240]|uniref:RNA polymerase sigma factor n=1 Tax=Kitasatospora sp. NBC_00240 TaxID=2903567 RepID=UPI002259D031|nr:RNA polymerase sigma factor [Kitasatospora sp. NBC_00240]MCX5215631.1 RNA polymerase sigma factor [Kitasatospora sp. NBC_00240]